MGLNKSITPSLKVIILMVAFMMLFHTILIGQDAEVMRQETTIEIKKGTLTRNHFWEIKINNKSGEKFTMISMPYSGLVQIGNIEAMIRDREGKIVRKLDRESISDRSNISNMSLYEDSYVKEFVLRHNTYPYTLTFSYEEQVIQFIRIAAWVPVLSIDVPTHNAELKLVVPDGYKVRFSSPTIEPEVLNDPGKDVTYTWRTTYLQPVAKPEVLAPPVILSLPLVEIVPLNFMFETEGSFESWITFGNWIVDLIGPPEDLPKSEQARIRSLIEGLTDQREILNILYHFLQDNTRYINVSIETGGFKPYPVSYVVTNKYGDCKALSNYFRSVLHFAGIKSYYSTIYAGDGSPEIDKSFPSQRFNHVILCVPVDGDTIWVDCTSDNPLGYVGTFIQNRDVLVTDRDRSYFSRTPALTKTGVEEIRVAEIIPTTPLLSTLTLNMSLRGDKFETLESIATIIQDKDQNEYISELLVPSGLIVKDFIVNHAHRDSNYINLSVEAEANGLYSYYGENIGIKLIALDLPDLRNPDTRVNPVMIEYPVMQTDSLYYTIPAGYTTTAMPERTAFESLAGTYISECLAIGDRVCVVRRFILNAGSYSMEEYPEIYSFIKKIKETEQTTIIIATKISD